MKQREGSRWSIWLASRRGRLALGGVATMLALASLAATAATVLAKKNPALAYRIAPWNGWVASQNALRSFTINPEVAANSRSALLAKQALRDDATAVDALIVLAFQAQLRGEQANSDAIFSNAERLSRRELRTHVWTIEKAVQRGDIGGALEGYDLALRTSRAASNLLYPVLGKAIAEPKVRSALLPMIKLETPWGPSFLQYAAEFGADPRATRQLFEEAAANGVAIDGKTSVDLVDALAAKGFPAEAWAFYRSYRPTGDPRKSRDPGFENAGELASVFDWKLSNGEGVLAEVLPGQDGNILLITSVQGASGVAVTQLQVLPPGRYMLQGKATGVAQPPRSRPYWLLVCADGRSLGRVVIDLRDDRPAEFRGEFAVPQNCDAQALELVVPSSDATKGMSMEIERAQLVTVSAAGN